MRITIIASALLGLFWLPWPLTLILMIAAGAVVPLSAVVLGVLVDLLYAPQVLGGVPLGLLSGLAACGAGLLIERFIRTRIIDA
jgi:hypothetical protein